MKRQIAAFTATVFLIGLSGTPALAQNIGNYLSSGGSTNLNRLSPTAPPPATASTTWTPVTPLRPPIAPSYSNSAPSMPVPQPIPIGALPPQAGTAATAGSSNSYSNTSTATTYNTGQGTTTSGTTTQGSTSSTDKAHHKGLAEDTVDVGGYIVKAYVYGYVILPAKLVTGVFKAIF